jgi:hypothetical protein
MSFSATYALDPGTAKGTMQMGQETIPLTHAYAQLHDNAEGLLARPKEMRILIVDRQVKREVLNGLVFLPVLAMTRAQNISGRAVCHEKRPGAIEWSGTVRWL